MSWGFGRGSLLKANGTPLSMINSDISFFSLLSSNPPQVLEQARQQQALQQQAFEQARQQWALQQAVMPSTSAVSSSSPSVADQNTYNKKHKRDSVHVEKESIDLTSSHAGLGMDSKQRISLDEIITEFKLYYQKQWENKFPREKMNEFSTKEQDDFIKQISFECVKKIFLKLKRDDFIKILHKFNGEDILSFFNNNNNDKRREFSAYISIRFNECIEKREQLSANALISPSGSSGSGSSGSRPSLLKEGEEELEEGGEKAKRKKSEKPISFSVISKNLPSAKKDNSLPKIIFNLSDIKHVEIIGGKKEKNNKKICWSTAPVVKEMCVISKKLKCYISSNMKDIDKKCVEFVTASSEDKKNNQGKLCTKFLPIEEGEWLGVFTEPVSDEKKSPKDKELKLEDFVNRFNKSMGGESLNCSNNQDKSPSPSNAHLLSKSIKKAINPLPSTSNFVSGVDADIRRVERIPSNCLG